jgi:hypothetical protein
MFRRFDAAARRVVPGALALAVFAQTIVAGQGANPSGSEVVARHVAAVGGEAAQKAVNSLRVTGRFEIPAQSLAGDLQIDWARPARRVLHVTIPGIGTISVGYDGRVGWSIDPAQGPALITGRQLSELADEAWFDGVLRGSDHVKEVTTLDRVEFDKRPAYKVSITYVSGNQEVAYYDVESGLHIGLEAQRTSQLGTTPTVAFFREYRKFGALSFPTVVSQRTLGIEQLLRIASVEYDVVPPGTFELPAPIKALVKGGRD